MWSRHLTPKTLKRLEDTEGTFHQPQISSYFFFTVMLTYNIVNIQLIIQHREMSVQMKRETRSLVHLLTPPLKNTCACVLYQWS